MITFIGIVTLCLLANLALGLRLATRNRRGADLMLAGQLFATTGTALLLLMAELQDAPALRDVALVMALLATITVVAFVQRFWTGTRKGDAP